MKKQVLISLVLAGSMLATIANAEESQQANTSTLKTSEVQKSDEKQGDIDNEITNAKMRAESGSKSQWSMQIDMSYAGGNLEEPLGRVRPNYSGEPGTDDVTYLDGTIEGSYRINKNARVSFGTGISVKTPLQANSEELTTSTENGGVSEVATPYISLGYSGRIAGIQSSMSLGYSHATSNFYTNDLKYDGTFSGGYTVLFDIPNSNWQPGVSLSVGASILRASVEGVPDYSAGLYPFAEYAFNDTVSFRTVFRPFSYNHLQGQSATTFAKSMYTQSVGIGIAATRDIYLYPNMQFAPENLKPELTNVGLNVTANMF